MQQLHGMVVQQKFLLVMLQIIQMKMIIVSVMTLMDAEYVMAMILPVQVVLILMHLIMTVIMEKSHLVIIILSLMMAVVSTIR